MFRATFLAATLLAAPLSAQTFDRDAAAALALASAARATRPAASGLTEPVSLIEAVAATKSRRVPVLVSVGVDCRSLCSTLRPAIVTTHAEALCGDRSPHMRLLIADRAGDLWQSAERWVALPTEAEVRAAAHRLDKAVNTPAKGPTDYIDPLKPRKRPTLAEALSPWTTPMTEWEKAAAAEIRQKQAAEDAQKTDQIMPKIMPPRAAAPNVGACPCGPGRCHCLPAAKCPGGCPAQSGVSPSSCPGGVCPAPARPRAVIRW